MGYIFNQNGQGMSLQVSKMVAITGLDTNNFKFSDSEGNDRAFLIKNEGDEPVQLQVKLWNDDDFVSTTFECGWNPELIREVAADAGIGNVNLKAGR